MVALSRRSIGREILALVLAAVVFVAAVVGARLQGGMPAAGPMAFGVICTSADGGDGQPEKSSGTHQHCALCALVSAAGGEWRNVTPLRFATGLERPAGPAATAVVVRTQTFEARGPPAEA